MMRSISNLIFLALECRLELDLDQTGQVGAAMIVIGRACDQARAERIFDPAKSGPGFSRFGHFTGLATSRRDFSVCPPCRKTPTQMKEMTLVMET